MLQLAEWSRGHPLEVDARLNEWQRQGDFGLCISCNRRSGQGLQVLSLLNRYQHALPLDDRASHIPRLQTVLEAHRALHASRLPQECADHLHALDTWRWLLRLAPDAPAALELAALFHAVERLDGETTAHVERLAPDHLSFKRRHAERGSSIAAGLLTHLGLPNELVARAAKLIRGRAQPSSDLELRLLNDADALSFFSLNSWAYLEYFGHARTRVKVDDTLSRMSAAARQLLATTRPPPAVARQLYEVVPAALGRRGGSLQA